MKCKQCQGNIQDDSKFCSLCGVSQQEIPKDKIGVLILDCQHCGGIGECKKKVTSGIMHSDDYCVAKSGIKLSASFPLVPCAYCGGIGKRVIDLKITKSTENQTKEKERR